MDLVVKGGLIALGVYVGLVGAMYLLQRKMMYQPAQALPPPAAVGAGDMAEVRLKTADGLELLAWYKPAARPDAAEIVYFHGNAGNISHRAAKVRPLLEAGHGVLLVSYRGYGGNPGQPSETGLIADGRAAYAFLRARDVPAARIALIGESLGSGVAVAIAAEREVALIMLEAPFSSAVDVAQGAYPFVPVRFLMKDPFDSLSRVGAIRAPLLVVHGENDGVVPVALGRRLFQAAAAPKRGIFIPDAGHSDLDLHGLLDLELEFLAEHLSS